MNLEKLLSLTFDAPELSSKTAGLSTYISSRLDDIYARCGRQSGDINNWWLSTRSLRDYSDHTKETLLLKTPATNLSMEEAKLRAKLIRELATVSFFDFESTQLAASFLSSRHAKKSRDVAKELEHNLPTTASVFIKEVDYF